MLLWKAVRLLNEVVRSRYIFKKKKLKKASPSPSYYIIHVLDDLSNVLEHTVPDLTAELSKYNQKNCATITSAVIFNQVLFIFSFTDHSRNKSKKWHSQLDEHCKRCHND